ncbi:MAG: hypothetical protein ACE15D_13780 [Candidatus Eisenbacteria bacterium]|nr:hypothetical protein [Candidatus Eisenbacteria bacterium]
MMSLLTTLVLLCVLAGSAFADSFEPNDTPETAAPIGNDVTTESWISAAGDLDWYAFETYRTGWVTRIRLEDLPGDYAVALFWRNTMTGEVETFDGWRSDRPGVESEELLLAPYRTGRFYVLVHGVGGAHDAERSYRLTVTWPEGGGPAPPSVALLSPRGGEIWEAWTAVTIAYEASDPDTPLGLLLVSIHFSPDGGWTWSPIVERERATGSHVWWVRGPATAHGRIRVTVTDGGSDATDAMESDLTITTQPPTLTLLAPNGGEAWEAGWPADVTYEANDPDTPLTDLTLVFDVSINSGATWERLYGGPERNTGEYSWLIYPFLATNHARLRATVSDGEHHVSDESDADFTILGPPGVKVVSPAGGERWKVGTVQTIRYEVTDGDTPAEDILVSLRYSIDRLRTWIPIALDQPNTGRYEWLVPGPPRDEAWLEVGAFDGRETTWRFNVGGFTIEPATAPLLGLAVLRNPGRPQSLQILVTADQPLTSLTVVVDGTAIEMEEVPGGTGQPGRPLYRGSAHLAFGKASALVQAHGSNGSLEGEAETAVVFEHPRRNAK